MKNMKTLTTELNNLKFNYEKVEYLKNNGFKMIYTKNLSKPENLFSFKVEKLSSKLNGNSNLKEFEGSTMLYIQVREKHFYYGGEELYVKEVPFNFIISEERKEKIEKISK